MFDWLNFVVAGLAVDLVVVDLVVVDIDIVVAADKAAVVLAAWLVRLAQPVLVVSPAPIHIEFEPMPATLRERQNVQAVQAEVERSSATPHG